MSHANINLMFPSLTYETEYLLTDEDNQKLIDKCLELKDECEGNAPWSCDIWTSFNYSELNLYNYEWFKPFMEAVESHVASFLHELYEVSDETHRINLVNCWFNESSKGQYQEQHTHPMSHLSFVYYLKAPEGTKGTRFYSTRDVMYDVSLIASSKSDMTKSSYYVPAEQQKLVIFESSIPHSTPHHTIDETRITISGNYILEAK